MGNSIKPQYVVEITCTAPPGMKQYVFTPSSWYVRGKPAYRIKGQGKPTDEKLEQYVKDFARGLEPGGVNFHLSEDAGYITYPTSAVIRENKRGGLIVASWKAAMFQVW